MKKSKISRSAAMTLAHQLKSDTLSFGKAISKAWRVLKVKQAMKEREVNFSFYKMANKKSPVHGLVIRLAKGTLNPDLIPIEKQPVKKANAKPRKQNPLQIKYFDLERMAWRSFIATRYCAAVL